MKAIPLTSFVRFGLNSKKLLSCWVSVIFVTFVVSSQAWILSAGLQHHALPSLPWRHQRFSTFLQSNNLRDIHVLCGSWNDTHFGATKCWGRRPLLLKGAFLEPVVASSGDDDNNDHGSTSFSFPTWNEILELACCNSDDEQVDPEMVESLTCRLIRHQPGALDSFSLEFGPFSSGRDDISNILCGNDDTSVSTLVVNDVDRWIPDLSDWMDNTFVGLPRWRRDDAQVSLAATGGGIGPHVDNYDVFLIQTSGHREWEVALEPISVQTEYDHLVEASQVRILNDTRVRTVKVKLEPGDGLYVPPRYQHWGTAISDDCVTLSVGCRAPSAADLLSKLAESISKSAQESAVRRYTDKTLWEERNSTNNHALTPQVKNDMKTLVRDLVNDILSDEDAWDELVGKVVTQPNRPVVDYPVPLNDIDPDWRQELGVWGNAQTALDGVLAGKGVLRRAEGVSFAWSSSLSNCSTRKLFAQGRSFSIFCDDETILELMEQLLDRIVNGGPISKNYLDKVLASSKFAPAARDLLEELLEEGLLYGDDASIPSGPF